MSDKIFTKEKPAATLNGAFALLIAAAAALVALACVVTLAATPDDQVPPFGLVPVAFAGAATAVFFLTGLYMLQPNESAAILLFGDYKGTDRRAGLRWVVPWYQRAKISLRVRNVTSQTLKVNDKRGNPIEIGAVVVWRVVNTAQALFDVEDFARFVDVQIETALREIASHFAYDLTDHEEPTLRSDGEIVAALMREKLQERVAVAGVAIEEAKLSHLAYAPEIASAMLRRQQADAVLAARAKIVQGAVDMVENALEQLSKREIVVLDDERRAAMVSNLLVVLCADREAQPVVNAGTLHP